MYTPMIFVCVITVRNRWKLKQTVSEKYCNFFVAYLFVYKIEN